VRLRVLALEPLTLQVMALLHRATRATQKVREARPAQSKSKDKGKAKVIDKAVEKAQKKKVAKLKVEITVNLEIIAQLEG
jgi:hypothetical protein